MMWSALFVQVKGWARSFQPSMYSPIASSRSLTLWKVPDGLAGDDPEEDLDHVQPGPAGRGEVQGDPRILREPGLDVGVPVGGVVVADHVQRDPRVGSGDGLEEVQELGVRVLGVAAVGHLPGRDLQRSEQARCPVALVVRCLFLRDPGPEGEDRRGPVQRLDLGLLVHTEHDRPVWGVHVEPDHVADLRFQLRVGGELERLRLPWLQAPPPPDPGDSGETDPQMVSEQPRRPMGHSQTRRRRIQRRRYHRRLIDRSRPTRPRQVSKISQATHPVPLTPGPDRRKTHAHPATDLRVTRTGRGQQQNPGPLRGTRRDRRGPRPLRQPFPITSPQDQRLNSRHTPSSQNST